MIKLDVRLHDSLSVRLYLTFSTQTSNNNTWHRRNVNILQLRGHHIDSYVLDATQSHHGDYSQRSSVFSHPVS